ncbi:MAG: ISL3 family transposase [Nitriliruptorales bacterium]
MGDRGGRRGPPGRVERAAPGRQRGRGQPVQGLRWVLLRNWGNLSSRQRGVIRDLAKANRRMFRAWQLEEELRALLELPLLHAQAALDRWLAWASRSKLAPFVTLARTIRRYRASIEATIEWKLTNGIAESNNAAIGRIRSAARGFQDPKAFITMIMLERADLAPELPWKAAA